MMTNEELIDLFRNVERSNYPVCNGCPMKYTCDKNQITRCLFGAAADALEAADEKITKLENPKAYMAVDFNGDYVLCQANYVYSDGTRLSSEIAKVRIPLEDGEHGISLGNNVVIAEERSER